MNTYADAIRRQAEDGPRAALPAVAKVLWTAFAAGQVSETEAEALSVLIEARQASDAAHRLGQSPNPTGTGCGTETADPRKLVQARRTGVGSRPRTDASLERRRRWAASGRLPPALAARFTLAEQAVLSLVAAETTRRGDCRLAVEHMAALTGVSRSSVKNALREARRLGLMTIEERRITGFRNDTNVVRIVSPEWQAWLRLARREVRPSHRNSGIENVSGQGGVKILTRTSTQISKQGKTRTAKRPIGRLADPNAPSQTVLRRASA